MKIPRALPVILFVAIVFTLSPAWVTGTDPPPETVTLSGTISILVSDPPLGSGRSAKLTYRLFGDQGQVTTLLLEEALIRSSGGSLVLNRARVEVTGVIVADPPGAVRVLSLRFETTQ